MMLHEKGRKSERDRAILINSYEVMCDEFRVPSLKRLTRANMAMMSNKAIYQASKDVYSLATVKQAKKLAIKMGLVSKKETWIDRIIDYVRVSLIRYKSTKGARYAKAN